MAVLEGLFILGAVGAVLYVVIRALESRPGHPAVTAGRWRVAHYDVDGHTRVVVHKVRPGSAQVLDEHVIAEIPVNDPEYDELFMTAMATARQRKAIFETEE
ncbi:hypothetical protein EKO23_01415 [Nocardioides guangzhouensis]|uniref:Uncharacterized protein n=1 Tax=Nocardioides guangzhouensis TaxID=2497878 RepID=A0A4V1Y006_9ACTN|nr:hypothetical protein [Nocardioides guangzhouensis]RYP88579.1 hypothetical protein EKO23_01415 [Nocardioides guangzhouensis]